MTADEIRETDESCKTEKGWLKEIAYQLALLNEKEVVTEPISEKRGPGRPRKNP